MYIDTKGGDYSQGNVLAKDIDGVFKLKALSGVPDAINDATNAAPTTVRTLRHTTSGTAAAGIAARETFETEDDAGTTVAAAAVDGGLSDVTAAAPVGFVDLWARGSAALVRAARFLGLASAVNYFQFKPAAAGGAIELSAQGTSADIDIKVAPKGTGSVDVDSSGIKGITRLSTPQASAEVCGRATVTGPATTAVVALPSITADDTVLVTAMGDPASAGPAVNNYWVTIAAGASFTINMTAAPAAPCQFHYLVVRRTA
jgi:hypothetical protein